MQIDIAPETERLVREEILSGHFRSADEVIRAGVEALREKVAMAKTSAPTPQASNLYDLFAPVRGLLTDEEIDQIFARDPSPGRPVDLT
jgi:Arc/MetJ-type ribon-helix-helix transcriptional regulator